MTVAELIAKLQEMPQDMEVFFMSRDSEMSPVRDVDKWWHDSQPHERDSSFEREIVVLNLWHDGE